MEHDKQRQLWDEEHRKPTALKAMDSHDPSNSVQKFWQFLVEGRYARAHGIEMGCGKGRNVIWLAKRGATMEGFDFSEVAIAEAKRRAEGINGVSLQVADATHGWPYESNYFDFGIDCFASTDIESSVGRTFALTEMKRVLKPGGYAFVTFPYMSPLRRLKAGLGLYKPYANISEPENFYQFALPVKETIATFKRHELMPVYKQPLDAVKGLKDEVSLLTPFFRWAYKSRSLFAKGIRFGTNLLFQLVASHVMLAVFQKYEK